MALGARAPLAEIPGVNSSGARRGLWSLVFSGCSFRKYEWHLRETKHRIKVNAFDLLQIICNPCGPVIIYTWLGHSNESKTVTQSASTLEHKRNGTCCSPQWVSRYLSLLAQKAALSLIGVSRYLYC